MRRPNVLLCTALCLLALLMATTGAAEAAQFARGRAPAEAAAVVSGQAAPARAAATKAIDDVKQLDLDAYSHMVVDPADHEVLVIGLHGTDTRILVRRFDGTKVGTLDMLGDTAEAATVVGSTIYVPDCAAGTIAAYDASTLAFGGSFSAGGAETGDECDIAYSTGLLWMPENDGMGLRSVTLDSLHTVTHFPYPGVQSFEHLMTNPAVPNRMVSWSSYGAVSVIDTSSGSPVVDVYNVLQLRAEAFLTNDANEVLTPTGSAVVRHASADLSEIGSYATGTYGDAVTETADGAYVVTAGQDSYGPDIVIYPSGSTIARISYDVTGPEQSTPADRGLAITPNSAALFVVRRRWDSLKGRFFWDLDTISYPTMLHTKLSVKAPDTVHYGKRFTVSVHLGSTTSSNRSVAVYSQSGTSDPVRIARGTVDGSGDFHAAVSLGRTSHVFARWKGDSDWAPQTSTSTTVAVAPRVTGELTGYYGSSNGYKLYRYSASCPATHTSGCIHYTVHVAPNLRRHHVYLVLQGVSHGQWKSIAEYRRRLGRHSTASFSIVYLKRTVIGRPYRVIAVYLHDRYHADGVGRPAYFRVTS